VYGRYPKPVTIERTDDAKWLRLGERRVRILHGREPHLLPWRMLIVDLSLTKVIDADLYAVYRWYDNEFGFTNTLLAHVLAVATA
jgi:glyceraldehyde-3-phosphate dehydrogenase/erythrose-4-phosphate dehydrogenase